ncbi:MAG: hypothetical protein IH914_08915 [candidate division Zixibacteria bacterium]|nr:hypothetical protein [candidate division Zixibacteria bacterium]
MVTLHVYYGLKSKPEKRIPELEKLAKWLAGWAKTLKRYGKAGHGHNLLALGDFNIDRVGDDLYDAFTSTGLSTPSELDDVPRTIFYDPEDSRKDMHYDQIAWFEGSRGIPRLTLEYKSGGFVNFTDSVMRDLTNTSLSWRMSDHFPLWVEFKV